MTKVITIFSCANDVHKIVIIRWSIEGRWHPKAFYETDKQPTGEIGERREVKKKKLARCS